MKLTSTTDGEGALQTFNGEGQITGRRPQPRRCRELNLDAEQVDKVST